MLRALDAGAGQTLLAAAQRRARLVMIVTTGLLALSVGYLPLVVMRLGVFHVRALFLFGLAAGYAVAIVVLRHFGAVRVAGGITVALFTVATLVPGRGGAALDLRIVPWTLLMPLVATLLVGRRWGLVSGVVVAAAFVWRFMSAEDLPALVGDSAGDWMALLSLLAVTLVLAGLAAFFETERTDAELSMRRFHRHFRELIDENPDGVVLHRDGEIVFANAALGRFLATDPNELLGRTLRELAVNEHRPVVDQFLVAQRPPPAQWRCARGDGHKVDLEWRVGPTVEIEGEWVPLLSVRDVTAQRAMQSRLMVAERMASVGTLAAGVAHEINNPLAYVLANLQYVLQTAKDGLENELREALVESVEGAERVRDIVQDLKTFGRPDEADEPQSAVLHDVLELAVNMSWNEIRHRAQLIREYGPNCVVTGSPSKLGQVFLNVLVNAAQAMPIGNASEGEVRIGSYLDGQGRVVVQITDTGSGIEADVLPHVFDPFFTTKPVGVGTGLGLAISHNVVTNAGGDIEIESEVGRGTTVRVFLPVVSMPIVAEEDALASETPQRRARILAIDDEAYVLRSLRRMLSDHEVIVARGGRDALGTLEGDARFDVVLLDLMMPDVSGLDLYEHLRAQHPQLVTRVVFITGGVFTDAARSFLQTTQHPVLLKPFAAEELHAVLAAVIGGPTSGSAAAKPIG